MSSRIERTLRGAACLLLTVAPALADDFYVDSAGGSNGNDGTTPATAWATITFALANAPLTSATGFHTIHVAPGTYSAATGETFPLEAEEMTVTGAAPIEIVSESGSGATTIDSGTLVSVRIDSRREFVSQVFFRTRIRRVEGFTIHTLNSGVVVSAGGGNLSPVLRDLVVVGGLGAGSGISFSAIADSFVGTSGDVDGALVEDCDVSGFLNGISMTSFGDLLIFCSCRATLSNTRVHDNPGLGLSLDAIDTVTVATLQGSRIENNGNRGVSLVQDGSNGLGLAGLVAESSVIAGNGAEGVRLTNFDLFGFSGPDVDLERCTVTGNTGAGIASSSGIATLDVDTCILFDNGSDILGTYGSASVEYSDVGVGNPSGSPTNIVAVPLFVNAGAGDYRLQQGSACIDAGDPGLPPDPDGTVADMGAFPFDQDATSSYCTGKTNSLGCVPFITWSGFASASAPQAFALTARDVLPGESGLLVYGFQAGNLNFHGGKLCVKAPLERYLPFKQSNSSGTPPCAGNLTRNFNARIQGGADAMLTAGQEVFVQWRLRDPADPAGFGDSLSSGARFVIAP